MPHDVISTCPVCASELAVTRLHCRSCGTTLEGDFSVGRFGRLNRDQLTLLESFLRSRGNLREMERELGISYPTVRSRVEALVRALGFGARADADDAEETPPEAPRHRPDPGGDPRGRGTPRDERRRGGDRHPCAREDHAMTTVTAGSSLEHPIGPDGIVKLRLRDGEVRLHAVDGETVRVRERGGRDLGTLFSIDLGAGSADLSSGDDRHGRRSRPGHRGRPAPSSVGRRRDHERRDRGGRPPRRPALPDDVGRGDPPRRRRPDRRRGRLG